MKKTSLIALFLLTTVAVGTSADNWPHWRGPSHNGVSDETNVPLKWSTTENVHWKLPLPGRSGSTPIIWGDRIFINVTDGERIELWCVNRRSGQVMWKKLLGGGNARRQKHNMSTPSPVTDGESLWVMTGTGILRRFDFNGNEIWTRDIPKEYGAFGILWGYGSSPLLHEDSL
jgi:outer membrane protein assembly factor BamB